MPHTSDNDSANTADTDQHRRGEAPVTGDASLHEYPDSMHPGLVPGIGVDEQRNRFSLDKGLFAVTALLVLSFIIWGVTNPDSVADVSASMYDWAMNNVGWLLNIVMLMGMPVMIYLGFSRFGNIKLGKDNEEPEFSRFSWIAMMFAAGLGVGIFFFGPSEPLWHYQDPPPYTVDPETPNALHQAMAQSHFHWGPLIWGLYALVGGALAYSSYRRGRVTLFSSVFRSLFGENNRTIAGRMVDMMAIIATLFGTAATLGLAATQIGTGVEIISGGSELSNNTLVIIIAVLAVGFIISAVSGVARGIRYLSNINIVLTLGLVLFVFIAGPTVFLLNLVPSGVAAFLDSFFDMASRSLSWGESTVEFQGAWTAFYWAWWIAWTPFVGMFIARISRGRTIREFALATTFAPAAILVFAFTVFGGTAITFSREGVAGMDGSGSSEQILFTIFENLPLSSITPFLIIFVLAVFFITSADSAATVMGTQSEKGNPFPNKAIVIFWGLCMAGIAVVMLLAGGAGTLTALQNLTILVAIPFSVVLIVLTVAFLKDLSTDPAAIRRKYATNAIKNAVYKGLEEHGDDFELSIERSDDGRGAGANFDSTSEKVTDWYRRTDEDGNTISYDYESGEYSEYAEPDNTTLPDAHLNSDTPHTDRS